MLVTAMKDHDKKGCAHKTFQFLARIGNRAQPYSRMESDAKMGRKASKGKESGKPLAQKDLKEKKKGWKKFRQIALNSCRYIGLGAAHMNPVVFSYPDYGIDPKDWNKSFSSSYKPKVSPQKTPHWTSNLMFAGW